MKALVGRALRLQEQTSLESLAIQLDDWYRQCAAGYVPEGWQDADDFEFMPDSMLKVITGEFKNVAVLADTID